VATLNGCDAIVMIAASESFEPVLRDRVLAPDPFIFIQAA
jgi:hypothetical protein